MDVGGGRRPAAVAAGLPTGEPCEAKYDRAMEPGALTRSDAELVEAVRGGDIEAFSELYRAHVPAVHEAVNARLHDPEAATDIVQDAFLRALRGLDALNHPARFRSWLLAIAHHLGTELLRSRARVGLPGDATVEAVADAGEAVVP